MHPVLIVNAILAILVTIYVGYLDFELSSARKDVAKADKELTDLRADAANKVIEREKEARIKDARLARVVEFIRSESSENNQALLAQRDALAARLRSAQARAATATALLPRTRPAPGDAAAVEVNNGPLLPAAIGGEDVDEAYRGDLIRSELLACYAQYDKALEALGQDNHAK